MSSSPKNNSLSLFSLPAKAPPPEILTPPLRSTASVPFRWEEAPGRPRDRNDGGQSERVGGARRSLELPPRLLTTHDPRQRHDSKITNMPSPTTVLEGPDTCRSMSFWSPDGSGKRVGYVGSRRWGSFRKGKGKGSNDFLSSVVDDGGDAGDGGRKLDGEVKMRRGSFLSVSSSAKSHLWGGIYESLKHVVSWKLVRNKTGK